MNQATTPSPSGPERSLSRLRSWTHRQASQRWLDRHRGQADPRVLDRLAAAWVRFERRRRGRGTNPQLWFAVFDRLAGLTEDRLPDADAIHFILRSLAKFPQTGGWEALMGLLNDRPGALSADDWRAVHRERRLTEEARREARVGFESIHDDLARFNQFLARATSPRPLRSESLSGFTAWTDGKVVTLPDAVDLTPHRLLNEWGYLRLLAHEVAHLEFGTFAFRFDEPEGKALWDRLAPRRSVFRTNRAGWDSGQAVKRLWRSGDIDRRDTRLPLPHLAAFTLHFPNPKSAHGLFNLIEDARIERELAGLYPALGEIARLLWDYEAAQLPHPRFISAAENFDRALYARALGLPAVAHVTRAYRPAWERIAPILDAFRRDPIEGVGSSLGTTLDVIEALEAELPRRSLEALDGRMEQRVRVAIEDLTFRLPRLARGSELDDYDPKAAGGEAGFESPAEQVPIGPGPFVRQPEFDLRSGTHLEDVVWVRERTWAGWREPFPTAPPRIHPPLHLAAPLTRGGVVRRLSTEGVEFDLNRAYDAVVGLRSGRDVDPRFFKGRAPGRRVAWTASIVVDLTVSLEAPRRGRGRPGDLPLARAVRSATDLAHLLERAGVATGVFGVHDQGRSPVTVYVAKGHDETGPARISTLHAVGAGGFRHGAAVRYLGRQVEDRFPGHRHLMILMTDAASHYLVPGYDRALGDIVRRRCGNCRARARCPVEPLDPRLTMRSNDEYGTLLYYPTYYEMADLKDALETNPHLETFLVLLDTGYSRGVLDRTVGSDRWLDLLTDADETQLVERIRRHLAGSC